MTTKQIIQQYQDGQHALQRMVEQNYVRRVRELLAIMREESFTNIRQVVAGNGTTTFSGSDFTFYYADDDIILDANKVSRLRDDFCTDEKLKTLRPIPSNRCIKAILELQQLCEWIENENLTTVVPYRVGLIT